MKTKATFYHAGCPVCVDAEKRLAFALDLKPTTSRSSTLELQKHASRKQKQRA